MYASRRTAISIVLAFTLASLASSAPATEPSQIVVTFGDLNLQSLGGEVVLYSRLEAAAKLVCVAREGEARSAADRVSACADDSLRRAIAQIGSPRLAALYATRTGHVVWSR